MEKEYNQKVYYDKDSPYDGTHFPVGTPGIPVNNLSDAIDICNKLGIEIDPEFLRELRKEKLNKINEQQNL